MSNDPLDNVDLRSETERIPMRELIRQAVEGHPRIVVVEGTELGQIVEVGIKPITLGRDPDNALTLAAEGVSRHHAVVKLSDDGVVIEDLGSKNGTFVNRESVDRRILEDGDILFIGAAILKYLSADNVERPVYEHLVDIGTRDALTDLPNRRAFDAVLHREIVRASRGTQSLALLIIDVDHFKRINDTHGHVVGDHVLKQLAEVMSRTLRTDDFLARYGGEEFAAVLTGERPDALIVAEKLRVTVQDHPFQCGGLIQKVTVSVGVARWEAGMDDPEALIGVADRNLYVAKKAGRNQVAD